MSCPRSSLPTPDTRTLVKLKTIVEALEKDGLAAEFEKASDDIPADRVNMVVEIEGRDPEEGYVAQIMFVPGIKEEVEDVDLLQFFVILYDELKAGDQDRLRDLLPKLNLNMPVGFFGLHEGDGYVYYRNVVPLARSSDADDKATLKVVTETAWLVAYLVNQGLPILEKNLGARKTRTESGD